jgi:benzylsuccinate CoA-transferase BbsF subunit
MGSTIYDAPPYRISPAVVPSAATRPAPRLGEHTKDVCSRVLGMDDTEFEELAAAGVFA